VAQETVPSQASDLLQRPALLEEIGRARNYLEAPVVAAATATMQTTRGSTQTVTFREVEPHSRITMSMSGRAIRDCGSHGDDDLPPGFASRRAYVVGTRHAFDADHIAGTDCTTPS
jgi:hypothetical protein